MAGEFVREDGLNVIQVAVHGRTLRLPRLDVRLWQVRQRNNLRLTVLGKHLIILIQPHRFHLDLLRISIRHVLVALIEALDLVLQLYAFHGIGLTRLLLLQRLHCLPLALARGPSHVFGPQEGRSGPGELVVKWLASLR